MNKTLKKTLSIILTILMIVTTVPFAFAATTPEAYDGRPVTPTIITASNYRGFGLTDENWSKYDGYYGIRNAKELYGFANLVNGMSGYVSETNAVLLQDIVVNQAVSADGATYNWTPIGVATEYSSSSRSPYFTGTFDGNGHTISGLYASGSEHIGLFGCTGYSKATVIKNVIVKNSYFSGSDYVGGIVGYMFWNNTTVSNCKVDSDVTVRASGRFVGGIVGGSYMLDSVDGQYGGYSQDNQVKNCVNFGTVKTTGSGNAVGGIAGAWAKETDYQNRLITVTNSYYLKGCASNSAGTVGWGCGTYAAGTGWADSTGCTALNSAAASHTCISVEHKETVANCTYPGLSNYSFCLICDKITSGTKTVIPANETHVFTGGNCSAEEICALCGVKGNKHPDNHASEEEYFLPNTQDSNKHDVYFKCCDVYAETTDHKEALNYVMTDLANHNVNYKCCGGIKETVSHNFVDSVCAQCKHICTHSLMDGDSCFYCGSKGVYYLHREWDGTKVVEEKRITPGMPAAVTSSTTTMESGWYIAYGNVDIAKRITVSGTVHLILADGAILNITGGIQLLSGNTLYIYATSNDTATTGKLIAKYDYLGESGIGGEKGDEHPGTLIVNGGYISATGSDGSAGIGGWGNRDYAYGSATGETLSLTVNGGQIVATGGYRAAGIGGGHNSNGGTVTINGGTVFAQGGHESAGIGGGRYGNGGTVTISGGNIKAVAGSNAQAIGKGIGGTSSGTVRNGNGQSVSLNTLTLYGVTEQASVTSIEGMNYGITDVSTLDTNKLYFYLPENTAATSLTAGGKVYDCKVGLTYYPGHDWSKADSVCARCSESCEHENFTDGKCDACSYECPHDWDTTKSEDNLTRPGFGTEGYYTYTCKICADTYTEGVERADCTACNEMLTKVIDYSLDETLTQEARDEIHQSYRDFINNNIEIIDDWGFIRIDLIADEQPIIDEAVAELQKIIDDAEAKIASGEYVKADYTEIDEAIGEIEQKLADENVTNEAKAGFEEIKSQLEEMKADENTSVADLAELEKALKDYEAALDAGIEDGTAVKADYSEIDEAIAEIEQKLADENVTDEAKAGFEEIKSQLEEMKADENTSEADLDELEKALKDYEAALDAGIEDGTAVKADYTEIDEAIAEIEQKLADENVTNEAKAGFEEIKSQLEEMKADDNTSEADLDELEKALEDYEAELDAGIEDGTAVKADYTEIDEAIGEIEQKFADENVTEEAKAGLEEIKSQLEEMKADENTSVADLDELEKALEDYEAELDAGIEDGTAVKADYTEIDEAIKGADEALEDATISDEMKAELDDIKADLEALKEDINTSKADVNALLDRIEAITEVMDNCAADNHIDENEDNICDNCVKTIICKDCGRPAHEGQINEYICLLITFIKLVVSLVKTLVAVA